MKKKTAIIIDADFINQQVFELTIYFERVLGRKIPQANFCHWLDCICLDTGLRPGDNEIEVSLVHYKETQELEYFETLKQSVKIQPVIFKDGIGTFDVNYYPIEDEIVDKESFIDEAIKVQTENKDIENIVVIPNWDLYGERLLKNEAPKKDTTFFVMQPFKNRNYYTENLGFSILNALGIKAEELK